MSLVRTRPWCRGHSRIGVTPDVSARSFDRPREREAPDVLHGTWLNGQDAKVELAGLTLVVAVKTHCDGCRAFVDSELSELSGFKVIVVSATNDLDGEWVGARRPILVSPDGLAALGITWPPFYVVVDAERRRIVTEGVVFAPEQVAAEIARYLPS